MALVVKDRVQETSTTSGTGTLTLLGAVPGFQSFAVIGNGNTTYYTIYDNIAQVWEVGIGTYTSSGTTLSRDTVLSNSSGTTSPLSLAGNTASVFVTYPAEKSVNLNALGNVTALGTVSSGTWNGSTIGVAYGGTGVTTSSGANSVVLRDADQNISVNRVNQANTNTTAAAGTTTLTAASSYIHSLIGTGGQTYALPDATTLTTGVAFLFNNLATGTLTIQDYATATIGTIPPGGAGAVFLTNNATVGGTWDLHSYLPEGVTFGTNAFNLGTAIVSGGTWQGGTIGTAYGGTGLTTFSSANYALYSTSASALTAGTLPTAAGGTNLTTYTTGDVIYASATNTLSKLGIGSNGQVLTSNGTIPTWSTPSANVSSFQTSLDGLTPSTATTGAVTLAGTLGATSGGTSQSTYTTGDILYASASNTLTKLPIGTSGQVLSVSGGIPSWSSAGGSTTLTNTTFTATSGQTTFSVTYTPALLQGVYRNGVKLDPSDYTATSGTDVILNTGANLGDNIQIQYFSALATVAVVNSISFGSTGLTPSTATSGIVSVGGTLATTNGGTGSTSTTYCNLTSNVTGTLPVANGGTGRTTNTAYAVICGGTTTGGAEQSIASVGTAGQVLTSNGAGALPTFQNASGGVTTISFGSTGLTPSTATSGAVSVGGTLAVGNGGTGTSTAFTSGSVVFAGASGTYTQDNANFFWDDTNNRLGIGTTSPSEALHVVGSVASSGVFIPLNSTTPIGYIGNSNPITGGSSTNVGLRAEADMLFAAGGATERMRITSAGLLQFNSGYGSVATAYGCRAWVNFNGTGTLAVRGSANVSSVTDNGTGTYTVNFTTAIVDNNYTTVVTARRTDGGGGSSGDINILGAVLGSASLPYSTAVTTTAVKVGTGLVSGLGFSDQDCFVAVFR